MRDELKYIRGTDAQGNALKPTSSKKPTVPWGIMLRSPNMWAIMCAYFTYVYCLWIFLSWLPSYLVEFRHFTLIKVGIFASLPLWAGVVGDTVGGLATDWLLAKTGNIKFARRAGGHHRHAGLRGVHRAGRDDRERLYRSLLLDRLDVLPRMHHRPVLGGADGHRRRAFRHGVRA